MEERPQRLMSYSSLMSLNNCEAKYHHRKVAKLSPDTDSVPGPALDIGSCFHAILEATLHTDKDLGATVHKYVEQYKLEDVWGLKMLAMCESYMDMHKLSGLKTVYCEFEIIEPDFIAYVDAVMRDDQNNWWIVDLKTASRWDNGLLSTLPYDFQMNLYGMRYKRLAKALSLDPDKFQGCRYRATVKPTMYKQSARENELQFVTRMANKIISTDIVIPLDVMKPFFEQTEQTLKNGISRAKLLSLGEVKPQRNYGYCMSYFKPCEYWSQCHRGVNYTDQKQLNYADGKTYEAQKELMTCL